MTKIKFIYDYKKDAQSWVYFAKKKEDNIYGLKNNVDFIPNELLKQIRRNNKKLAEKLVYGYLINNPKEKARQIIINQEIRTLRKIWRKIESKFFNKLGKITQKPVSFKSVNCYITTGVMCPYNEKENWFMVSIWHNFPSQIKTICHEILHLHFLYHYRKHCKKFISEKLLQDLKEAITFILNTDFDDIVLSKDNGYPSHQKLRKKLQICWEEEKGFKKFLDKAIEIMKDNKL